MSLEVDNREANGKFVIPRNEEKISTLNGAYAPKSDGNSQPWQQGEPAQYDSEITKRLRRLILYLIIALLVILAIAIVAAAVGGSIAAKRQHQIKQCVCSISTPPC